MYLTFIVVSRDISAFWDRARETRYSRSIVVATKFTACY